MSLINDMLRDLAEREPRSAHSTPGIAVVPKAPGRRPKPWGRLGIFAGLIGILLAFTIWVTGTGRDKTAPTRTHVIAETRLTPPLGGAHRPHPLPRLASGTGRGTRFARSPSKQSPGNRPCRPSPAQARIAPPPPLIHETSRRVYHPAPAAIRLPQTTIEITPTRPETPARKISLDLARALRANDRGEWQRAILNLKAALTLNPDLWAARLSLVGLEVAHGGITTAHRLLVQGIELTGTSPAKRERALDWLARTGMSDTAWVLSRRYAPNPLRIHPRYLTLEAALAQATHHWHEASRLYGRISSLQPDNGWAWAGLGIALDQLGQDPGALQADRKALSLGMLTPQLTAYLKNRIRAIDQTGPSHEPPPHP